MPLVYRDRRRRLAASLVVLTAFVALRAVAAPLADGPYVTQQADGTWLARWVEGDEFAPQVKAQRVTARGPVVVPVVGSLPAFKVRLRPADAIAPDEISLSPDTPLFVVADTHGEYEILSELLQKHRVVDDSLRWVFDRGHLVVLGDVFDRGPNQVEILWLIYKLEAEAAKAGGGVHLVLGNHEALVLSGDLRYLNPKYVRSAQVLGASSYSELVGPRTLLGRWLRTKPAVLKIGDLLCLHGGISREVVERKLTLQQLNAAVRDKLNGSALSEAEEERARFVMGQLGPLWYRGYFAGERNFPTATAEDVDRIREHFGVNTTLVGHTIVPTVTSLYDGRVIAVQVYPHRDEKSGLPIMEALRIEKGRFLRARIDGMVEPLEAGP